MKPRVLHEGRAPNGTYESGAVRAETLAEAEQALSEAGVTGVRFFNDRTFGDPGADSVSTWVAGARNATVLTYGISSPCPVVTVRVGTGEC